MYRKRYDLNWKDVVRNFVEQTPEPTSVNGILFFSYSYFSSSLFLFFFSLFSLFFVSLYFSFLFIFRFSLLIIPILIKEITNYLFQSNNTTTTTPTTQTKKPHAYWTTMKGRNMKLFFDKFAQKRNMDPLIPDNWYPIMSRDVKQEKVTFNHCNY